MSEQELMNMSLQVVMASDQRYASPLATTMRSLVDNNRDHWPIDFHVFCEGFSDELRHKVMMSLPSGSASFRWIQIDVTTFGRFFTPPHISKMTYARLLIPDHFAEDVARVLYIDSDLLVLGDVGPLWFSDLEGCVLGAVCDSGVGPAMKFDNPVAQGVPRVYRYFNAGVLLIDVQRWREDKISEMAMEYLTLNPHTPFADQDALNVACDLNWKPLHAYWNFQNHYEKRITDLNPADRPAIVHFVTKNKPWIPKVASPNKRLYDAFRSRTSFSLTKIERLIDNTLYIWAVTKQYLKHIVGICQASDS